jgi:hypothetical protein
MLARRPPPIPLESAPPLAVGEVCSNWLNPRHPERHRRNPRDRGGHAGLVQHDGGSAPGGPRRRLGEGGQAGPQWEGMPRAAT